ncbi:MAG: hypothetical protein COT14_02190 [Candidatus Diapherotrites archaeon CG08_land_8_20_14_0_20_30_16]|nr:MAG: hypothetical protein COT14_02190 [Candidatus Diapherotrites archaeon CG08_land_8_20_14_0_20_30_16]
MKRARKKKIKKVEKIQKKRKLRKPDKTKILNKKIKLLTKKLHKKNKLILKLQHKQKEIYENRDKKKSALEKELEKAKKESKVLPKEEKKAKESVEKLEKVEREKRKLEKELMKIKARFRKKNADFMTVVASTRKMINEPLSELEPKLGYKDKTFIVRETQKEIDLLRCENETLKVNLKGIELDIEKEKQKVDEIKKELAQKDTIIQIMERGEIEIKGIVQTKIDGAKVRWLGWPEGGVLEEIDLSIINNSLDTLRNIHIDLSVRNSESLITRLDKLPAKRTLGPKEKITYKVNLFKYLKKRGTYNITVRLYSTSPPRELDLKEKTIIL